MPNHYQTVGLCGRDWRALEAKGLDECDFSPLEASTNLCEIVCPTPDALNGIVSSTPKARYVHKETGEVCKGNNTPRGKDADQYDKVELTDSEVEELRREHGGADWYEWCREHWGTKWGTYELSVTELPGDGSPVLIAFQSAWSPPKPAVMQKITDYLCETYCLKNIKWIGHDPYDHSTEDIPLTTE